MSSHHIIREDQEPALVIDTPSGENLESIQQLLEWSPTVMVTERALDQVLLWGIKIDVVVATAEKIPDLKVQLENQFPLKVLSCNTASEAIDTALYFLAASKQKSVNIVSDFALETFEKFHSLEVAVIQNERRWIFIRSGHFEKWLPAKTTLARYPKSSHPEMVIEEDGMITIKREHSFWISEVN